MYRIDEVPARPAGVQDGESDGEACFARGPVRTSCAPRTEHPLGAARERHETDGTKQAAKRVPAIPVTQDGV